MRFDVVTLFPEMFSGYLGQSLLAKAIEANLVSVNVYNLRDWAKDKHQKVDDRPFGGGPGMVLMVEPVVDCVEAIQADDVKPSIGGNPDHSQSNSPSVVSPGKVIMLTPQGKTLNQQKVEELSQHPRLILLCGRYEGFDERVRDILQPDEISMGDFILNGGEVAAMVTIDATVRLIPGVLGDEESSRQDSFSANSFQSGRRLLEYPQYTRPREFRGHSVPEILLSGDHPQIARWREEQSIQRTREKRRDLLDE
ncbi:MAG: tRNA (guanosine(37)-N1)-methyltransferase TrmD [Pirellulales bacterium]|nr:tRNA (guanosine(37)-N1)-methyltransferase TrmD [Pirellulales bacterium]